MSKTKTETIPTLRLTSASKIKSLLSGIQTNPLPPYKKRNGNIAHAPYRTHNLSVEEKKLAVKNALRYFPQHTHAVLAKEFAQELHKIRRF